MLDRRTFLAFLGGLAAERTLRRSGGLSSDGLSEALGGLMAKPLDRVGLQLYTVRDEMKKDVAATLAHVASIGYKDVELAGIFDKTPAEFRKLLDDNGLKAPSMHVQMAAPDQWATVVEQAKTIGCEYVTIPWIDEKARQSIDDFKRIAEEFGHLAEVAKSNGLHFAYHNHDFELHPMGGQIPLDVLISSTDPSLVSFEMDIYWVVKGGGDPMAFLKKYPGRFSMVHAKDATAAPERKMVDVGRGTIDFAHILPAFLSDETRTGGAKHVFVEHDQPSDPWASVAFSYATLKKLG